MKRVRPILPFLLVSLAVMIADQSAPAAASAAGGAGQKTKSDETAIRRTIASYVKAFNRGDAKTIAGHWTLRGQFVTPAGDTLRGQKQLEDGFASFFQDNEKAKIELVDTAIDILSPSVARETGVARVLVPRQEPKETEYEALHVKTAEGWKIDSVREQETSAPAPSHFEQLKNLEWMIGRWVDADENSTVEVNCRWTTNRNFLVRSFKVLVEDRVDFAGTQVIGWDPHALAIRSWLFDSDGGFGTGRWSNSGNRWSVQTLSILPDGRRASSTNIYDVVDEDTVRFRSIGRQVDGELLLNIDPITIVRSTDQ